MGNGAKAICSYVAAALSMVWWPASTFGGIGYYIGVCLCVLGYAFSKRPSRSDFAREDDFAEREGGRDQER